MAIFLDLAHSDLFAHIYISTWRVLLGFIIGSGLGLILRFGLIKQEAYLEPTFSAIKSIPSLAWIPLLLLWLGIDEGSKITLIAIGAFFPTYTNAVAAIHNVDKSSLKLEKFIGLMLFSGLYLLFTGSLSGHFNGFTQQLKFVLDVYDCS